MKMADIDPLKVVQLRPRINGVKLGRITGIREGEAFVDYEGNPFGPLLARTGSSLPEEALVEAQRHSLEVLLVFAEQDSARPIVLDVVRPKRSEQGTEQSIPAATLPTPDEDAEPTNPMAPQGAISADVRLAYIRSLNDGVVYIDFEGNQEGPRPARSTVPLRNFRDPVLTVLVPGGEAIILGQIYPIVPLLREGPERTDVTIKGERVVIEASAELVLVAGTCKIHLDARGKAVILADQVISRARGTNKVHGGSVQLN